jgi:hypothetical protein
MRSTPAIEGSGSDERGPWLGARGQRDRDRTGHGPEQEPQNGPEQGIQTRLDDLLVLSDVPRRYRGAARGGVPSLHPALLGAGEGNLPPHCPEV